MLVREQLAEREVSVFLPPSYQTTDRHFPVVYVQDGGQVVQGCFNLLQHMAITGEIVEIIYVGLHTTRRNLEYTPWASYAVSMDRENFGGGGDAYLKEIIEVVKPQIDSKYRTLSQAEHTGIAGYSLGGLISLYALYRHADVFTRYAILSPSLWFTGFLQFMDNQVPLAPQDRNRIYIHVGEREGIYKQNVQKEMLTNNRQAYRILQKQGYSEECLKFVVDSQGTHDAVFFMQYFTKAMQWLFRTS